MKAVIWAAAILGGAVLVVDCAGQIAVAQTKQPIHASNVSRWGGDADLLLIDSEAIARLRVRVEVDGLSSDRVWDRAIHALFNYRDSDRDGKLSAVEAMRLPTPFNLRRLLWGNFALPSVVGDGWQSADTDADEKLSEEELRAFYQREGVGIQIGEASVPATASLNAALIQQLDRDGNGAISVAELRTAENRLAGRDLNEDELISPGELVRGINYPGASGASRILPLVAATKLPEFSGPAVLLLPADPGDTRWAKALRSHLAGGDRLSVAQSRLAAKAFAALDTDGDGSMSVVELARWRERPANLAWVATFGKDAITVPNAGDLSSKSVAQIENLSGEGLRISCRTDPGRLADLWAQARQRVVNLFDGADANQSGFLDEKSPFTQKDITLKALLSVADQNSDGKLTRAELDAWFSVSEELLRGQILITILNHGHGLFEYVDEDHDGALSVRELRAAISRLERAKCFRNGAIDFRKMPRTLQIAVSFGHPTTVLPKPHRQGPSWFLAMDQNGDGDISRKEWKSEPNSFGQWDLDHDGLLSEKEAVRVGKAK